MKKILDMPRFCFVFFILSLIVPHVYYVMIPTFSNFFVGQDIMDYYVPPLIHFLFTLLT